MKEKIILATLFLVALMLAIQFVPVKAWEYWDTTIANPQHDNLVDYSGPHADKVEITIYNNAAAEFAALGTGIDLTDSPLDSMNFATFTTPPQDANIAVVDNGPEFGMYILDMQLNPNPQLSDGSPNPAYTAPFGNPMADVWLRRAIATCIDRPTQVLGVVSGGSLPILGEELYTPLSSAYGQWVHPELKPTGALQAYTYVKPDGSKNVALGNQFLDDHGYNLVGGVRQKNGVPFTLSFYFRNDDADRAAFKTALLPDLTAPPPTGLGLAVTPIAVNCGGAKASVMAGKMGHLYTGGWGLTEDPDHLYYLFHINNYWHPGEPPNYMYYPGDDDTFLAPYDDYFECSPWYWHRDWGHDLHNEYGAPDLNFTDTYKSYDEGTELWENPQNYWSWQMMIATDFVRAQFCAYKSQEFLAYWVCGEPVWCSRTYSAFSRRYVGTPGVPDTEDQWEGQPWKGVVCERGGGVGNKWSLYDMHPANSLYGSTIRWGFRQAPLSLNPIYAEWYYDWNVLNQAYDSLIVPDPYIITDEPWLAHDWEVGTWDASLLGLGTCTKVTFNLRHDVLWSDGVPFTASDVKFTWGGPYVTGSLSNLLAKKGYPPASWSSQVADILSIATPDPWTVIVYLDTYSYFGLHSMSGFHIVLPEHTWKPIIETGDPTNPWNQPCVCTGGYTFSTADPAPAKGMVLTKNSNHFHVASTPDFPKTKPINIWTIQSSNATAQVGNTHWIYPRKGETGVDAYVDVYMHSKYFYEDGPYKENVYPNTVLDGMKTVELWVWSGIGCPNDNSKYVFFKTLAAAHPFEARFCEVQVEHIPLGFVPAWWWEVKVTITITSLTVDGVPIPETHKNPFYGMTYVYKEHMIVTSRYDIGGLLYKPCPPATPKYQPIDDLKVNVKDIYQAAKAYGSIPGYPNWDTAADINGDYKVDVKDYYAICQNYGWAAPNPL